jgi:hypothetical protein
MKPRMPCIEPTGTLTKNVNITMRLEVSRDTVIASCRVVAPVDTILSVVVLGTPAAVIGYPALSDGPHGEGGYSTASTSGLGPRHFDVDPS